MKKEDNPGHIPSGHIPYKFFEKRVDALIDNAIKFGVLKESQRDFIKSFFGGSNQVMVLLFEAVFTGVASSQRKIVELNTNIAGIIGEKIDEILDKKLGAWEERLDKLDEKIEGFDGKLEELEERIEALEE